MGFKLGTTNVFELPGTAGRFIHIATVHNSMKEYICFIDTIENRCYIEDITGGSLKFIEDDNLAFDIAKFLEDIGITDMKNVSEVTKAWRRKSLPGFK